MSLDKLTKEDLEAAARMIRKLVNGRTRVLFMARLLELTLEGASDFTDKTETAAAIKSLLVVRSAGFTEAEKAATEALMSRQELKLGLQEAYEQAIRAIGR